MKNLINTAPTYFGLKVGLCLTIAGSLLGCGGGDKSMVLDCSGKTIVSDYVVKGASTEKRTEDTIRMSIEGKSVDVSGTAAKHFLRPRDQNSYHEHC